MRRRSAALLLIAVFAAPGRGEGLKLNERTSVSLNLPATLLAPGDYTVEVDGRGFTFRILK